MKKMTSIIVLAIGAGAAGFILGALLVHWSYRPVRYEKAPHEWDCTRSQAGIPEYKGMELWQPKHKIPSTVQPRRWS